MDLGNGMVAVVRGLPEAALAVTLLEGNRQYTLLPNGVAQSFVPVPRAAHESASTEVQEDRLQSPHCHSAAQAVDGRYASVYKMTHCNVQPTSPPQQLTEFPPQKAEVCRGHGNFEVGGLGSGESSFSPTRANGSYRGGLIWADRGAVCTPRPSQEPDAFAKSLRKYPAMSPERSTEIVERLINYTQTKNLKQQSRSETQSGPRAESPPCRRGSATVCVREGSARTRVPDESPTRDTTKKCSSETESSEYKRPLYSRNYDMRYLRDSNKRAVKDSVRNISTYPYCHPVCPTIKERYDHLPPTIKLPETTVSNSVHMETQAEIPMVSQEVSTIPRLQPVTRNVAVPLSPTSSYSESPIQQDSGLKNKCSVKSIQTARLDLTLMIRKSVQTCISSVDLPRNKTTKIKSSRKSKSEEEIRISDDPEDELLELIKDLSACPDTDTELDIRNELLRKLKRLHKTNRNGRVKIKFGRCIRDELCTHMDFKNFTRELSKELISKIKRHNRLHSYNPINVYRTETVPCSNDENSVEEVIRRWLTEIPIKPLDFLGRHVKKDQVLYALANKIKKIITDNARNDCYSSLKADIFDVIEDVPIEVNARHKMFYLNRKLNELVKKIEQFFTRNVADRKLWERSIDLDKTLKSNLREESFVCKHVQPTEDELKQFVKEEMKKFTAKFRLNICPSTEEEVEIELIDILIDYIGAIRFGNDEQAKQEILILLTDLIDVTHHDASDFVNSLIINFKDMHRERPTDNFNQTFIVLQHSVNMGMQTQKNANYSIEGITDEDIQNHLESYTQQLIHEINEWMTRIQSLAGVDTAFKQVVANDLAGDIADRHKYLELNPTSKGTDADELEHLKYQIFKWVNKLVEEDNSETIDQASDLMQRIQSIPVPMLSKSIQNNNTSLPLCCQKRTTQNANSGGKRRHSSPGDGSSRSPGVSRDLKIDLGQRRRQSSPNTVSENAALPKSTEQTKSKYLEVLTDHNTTASSFNQRTPTTSKKSAYTETDISKIPKNRPQGVTLSMGPAKESVEKRRFSDPSGFTSGSMPSGPRYQPGAGSSYGHGPTRANKSAVESLAADKPSCCKTNQQIYNNVASTVPPTLGQLNDDYDEYLKNWVQRIPIQTTNPEEEAVIEKMRSGILNGIWKSITKLKLNPMALQNPLYYQDVLDDELEELLDLLPSSEELTKKKQPLKSELIDKTTTMMEKIVANIPSTFKQQLIENVTNSLKRQTDLKLAGGLSPMKYVEEFKKVLLVDDFILYKMYKENDRIKANVYRKKLTQDINEYIEALKKEYGRELVMTDYDHHRIDIINALYKVPVPNDDTIKEEADEILLGLEIEEWFADLPMYPARDYSEMVCRKIYRDILAKKVHEMVKEKGNIENCEEELSHEIMKLIDKAPLSDEERQNSQFMCDQLINRLKNRSKDLITGSECKRKSVYFMEPHDYDEFSRDMALCSSFIDSPDRRRPQVNDRSYMIVGGERVDASTHAYGGQNVQTRRDATPESQQQWYSLFYEPNPPSALFSGPGPKTVYGQPQNGPQNFPQPSSPSQTPFPPMKFHDETFQSIPRDTSYRKPMGNASMAGGQSQARDPSFRQTMGEPSMMASQSQVRDPSLRQKMGEDSMMDGQPQARDPTMMGSQLRDLSLGHDQSIRRPMTQASIQRSLRQELQSSDQPEYSIPQLLPGHQEPRSPRLSATRKYSESFEQRRSPTSEYAREGSTRPYSTRRDPDVEPSTESGQPLPSPSNFSREPIGYSTPHWSGSPPRESRPKKRGRGEIDKSKKDAARRRLDLENSDDDIREEVRCRCMERIWRCRRNRQQAYCDDFDMDYPHCLPMRCPFPFYF